MSFETDEFFENEVRRIARARWPEAQYSGAAKVAGRERDGIFETEEVIHFIEVTTSRKEDKAKELANIILKKTNKVNKSAKVRMIKNLAKDVLAE